jgi:hypothetical protein
LLTKKARPWMNSKCRSTSCRSKLQKRTAGMKNCFRRRLILKIHCSGTTRRKRRTPLISNDSIVATNIRPFPINRRKQSRINQPKYSLSNRQSKTWKNKCNRKMIKFTFLMRRPNLNKKNPSETTSFSINKTRS